jgi:hypothetical protein
MNGLIAAMVFGWVYLALALVWRYRGERPMESLAVALRMMSPEQRRNVLAPYVSASEAAAPRRVSAGMWGGKECAMELLATDNEGMLSPIRQRGVVSSGPVKAEVAMRAAIEAQKARLASLGTSEAFKRPRLRDAGSTLNGAGPAMVTG